MRKRKKSIVTGIKGSGPFSSIGVELDEVRSLVLRRRLQILVHSCIYYDFNQNLVSDHTWTKWARELVRLQREYPDIASRVDYHKEFKDFDSSTGYNLPYRNPEIMSKARWLLERSKDYGPQDKPGKPDSRPNVIRVKIP